MTSVSSITVTLALSLKYEVSQRPRAAPSAVTRLPVDMHTAVAEHEGEVEVENDMQKKSLTALVRHHLDHARDASSGRSAQTVYGGHVHVLRQTVIALRAGQRIAEHDNLGEATVQILEGRIVLTSGESSWSGWRGDLITVPSGRSSLEAVEEAAILLTVAKLIAPAHHPEPVVFGKPMVEVSAEGTDEVVFDARTIPLAIRHAAVFGALDAIAPGFALDVIEPHDPERMLVELEQKLPGSFNVSYIERGPENWRVRLTRASR